MHFSSLGSSHYNCNISKVNMQIAIHSNYSISTPRYGNFKDGREHDGETLRTWGSTEERWCGDCRWDPSAEGDPVPLEGDRRSALPGVVGTSWAKSLWERSWNRQASIHTCYFGKDVATRFGNHKVPSDLNSLSSTSTDLSLVGKCDLILWARKIRRV
jgi:hypothetical protein